MRLPGPERRQQLLDTAIGVFALNDFHNTSMNDVAEAAGVTKPVLYQHFGSKRDLYLQILEDVGSQLRDTIANVTANAGSPRQQIERGFTAYFTFIAEHPDAYQVLFGSGPRNDEEFAEEARKVQESIAEMIAGLIEVDGITSTRRLLLANAIVGLAEGACHFWLVHEMEMDPSELATEVSQLAFAGLRGIH